MFFSFVFNTIIIDVIYLWRAIINVCHVACGNKSRVSVCIGLSSKKKWQTKTILAMGPQQISHEERSICATKSKAPAQKYTLPNRHDEHATAYS